jgi:hypothetical protein
MISDNVYRLQTAEPVSLLPKISRSFAEYLFCLGYENPGVSCINDVSWISEYERNSYLNGVSCALQSRRS